MKFLTPFLCTLALALGGCYLENRPYPVSEPLPPLTLPAPVPVVPVIEPLAYVVNSGAVIEIILMNQTMMDTLVYFPGYIVGGYAPEDRLEVWVVVEDIETCHMTPLEAGVMAHELQHKAEQLDVTYWRILRLASTEDHQLDTHEYGNQCQGVMEPYIDHIGATPFTQPTQIDLNMVPVK